MSATEKTAKISETVAAAPAPEQPFEAKLVRGSTYYLRDRAFLHEPDPSKGWTPISAADKEHLDEHAVDAVTIPAPEGEEPEAEYRAKFQFRAAGSTAPAVRRRTRPAAE